MFLVLMGCTAPRSFVGTGGYNGELIRGDLSVGHEIESNFSLKN